MKKTRILVIFAVIALAALFLGWAMPPENETLNLEGTWLLDKEKSDMSNMPGFGGGRRGSRGGGFPGGRSPGGGFPGGGEPGGNPTPGTFPGGRSRQPDLELTLSIEQTETELRLLREYDIGGEVQFVNQVFTLDGTENTNPAFFGSGEFKSKSKLEKDKLVIEGSQTMSTRRGDMEIGIKEEYSLSKDGKTLTVKTEASTPMGKRNSTLVFQKTDPTN